MLRVRGQVWVLWDTLGGSVWVLAFRLSQLFFTFKCISLCLRDNLIFKRTNPFVEFLIGLDEVGYEPFIIKTRRFTAPH